MNATPPPLPPDLPKKPDKDDFLVGCCVAAGIGAVTLFILSILAAALFPAISSAIDSARATRIKSCGRGTWVAFMSANSEREIHGLPPLWPGDLAKAGVTFENAEAYFTYLMSDGENINVTVQEPADRIVGDFGPSTFFGHGIQPLSFGGPMRPENNPWHVVMVSDDMPAEMPFLISRNVKASAIAFPTRAELDNPEANGVLIPLDKNTKPLGGRRAVWVTKGGSTIDARPRLFSRSLLFSVQQPEDEPPLTALPAQGGFQ